MSRPAESGDSSDDSEARAAAAAARREPLPALEDTGDGWEAEGMDEVERVLGHRWDCCPLLLLTVMVQCAVFTGAAFPTPSTGTFWVVQQPASTWLFVCDR